MQHMRRPGAVEKAAHPGAGFAGIGREIEDDGEARIEKRRDMRGHGGAQPRGAAHVVGQRGHVVGIKRVKPVVFRDQNGGRGLGEAGRQGRFARGDLAAEKMQGGLWCRHGKPRVRRVAHLTFRR